MKTIKTLKKLLDKTFWYRNWKKVVLGATVIAVFGMIVLLFIGGQRDVGAQEAGQQIVALAKNIRNRYKTRPDFWGLNTNEVIRKKIYPLSMNVVGNSLIGYFNNPVVVGADADGSTVMPTSRSFVIAYKGLNKQQCIGLASLKFDPDFWLGVSAMVLQNDEISQKFDWGNKEFILPAKKDIVEKLCKGSNNNVVLHFE